MGRSRASKFKGVSIGLRIRYVSEIAQFHNVDRGKTKKERDVYERGLLYVACGECMQLVWGGRFPQP